MIYIFGSDIEYQYFSDYAQSITKHAKCIIIITKEYNDCLKHIMSKDDYYLFLQKFPNKFDPDKYKEYKNIYLINTEQINAYIWKQYIENIIKLPINLMDYSYENSCLIQKQYNKKSIYLPYQVNKDEIYNFPKIYDVAMIGYLTPRREKELNDISKLNIPINFIKGWNQERDQKLLKHKILVNIHAWDDCEIFEEMRCVRCILNKIIIITEKSLNLKNHPLYKYMIECNYKDIPEITQIVLKNYDRIYEQLFANFDLEKWNTYFHQYIENIFEKKN